MTRTTNHDGAAVKAWNLNRPTETEQEPDLWATYLIGLSSTIDPAHWTEVIPWRFRGRFCRFACGL